MQIPKGYYAVLFKEPSSSTIGVKFPDQLGVVSFGADWKSAEKNAKEALNAALESEFERGLKLQKLRKTKVKRGKKNVFFPIKPENRPGFLLRDWRESAGLTQKDI